MFDVAVVGLGAMGSAVAWHAARLGLSVIGLDQHRPPHMLGSTHAETRVTRLAVGEGDHYVPFVARAHQLWRELEAETGQDLLHITGGHIITEDAERAERWTDFTSASAAVAARHDISYEVFDGAELAGRHGRLLVSPSASVGFEPSAGIVMCERAVEAQLARARALGADLRFDAAGTVRRLEPATDRVIVVAGGDRVEARHVVLATGAWLPEFLGPMGASTQGHELTVTRQVVYWFEADDLDDFRADRFPFVMWIKESIEDYFAVFPVPPGSATAGVKMLGEQFARTTDPTSVDRIVSPDEIAAFHHRNVAPHVVGVSDRCIRAEVCLYTNTPDDRFLIDTLGDHDRVMVVSACSGHGFKHSTALGEAIAQRLATGASDLDLAPFAGRST